MACHYSPRVPILDEPGHHCPDISAAQEATLLHDFDELVRFVNDRTREQVRAAHQAGDDLRSRFALGSLGILDTMRDCFRSEPISRVVVIAYFRRTASLYRHHPSFRSHWWI